jgi:hypothetical protein
MSGPFVSSLMHSRTQAHVFHLRTRSFAQHKALQAYYEAIVPLLDSYAEAYQGKYGLLRFTVGPAINNNPASAKGYFTKLLKSMEKVKPRDSYLKNIFDSIYELVYQTLYMLSLK